MTEPKRKTTDPKFIPSVFALTMGLFISTGILLFQNCSSNKGAKSNLLGQPIRLPVEETDGGLNVDENQTPDSGQIDGGSGGDSGSVDGNNNGLGGDNNTNLSCFDLTSDEVKVIFMVDHSSSTESINGGPGTDPSKSLRRGSIENFLAQYSQYQNLSYLFGVFGGNVSGIFGGKVEFYKGPFVESATVPFGDANYLSEALGAFDRKDTFSSTNYFSALEAIKQVVERELGLQPNAKFSILFYSDGRPNLVPQGGFPLTNASDGTRLVNEKLGHLRNSLILNTVYFCEDNCEQTSKEVLEGMAIGGSGNFINVNGGAQINVDELLSGRSTDGSSCFLPPVSDEPN